MVDLYYGGSGMLVGSYPDVDAALADELSSWVNIEWDMVIDGEIKGEREGDESDSLSVSDSDPRCISLAPVLSDRTRRVSIRDSKGHGLVKLRVCSRSKDGSCVVRAQYREGLVRRFRCTGPQSHEVRGHWVEV